MELVLLIGIPASGKSSFYVQRLFGTHVRLSLDVQRTRNREYRLFEACLATQARVAIDDTNASRAERALFIGPARAARFSVVGYHLCAEVPAALERNALREGPQRVPDVGLLATQARLQLPEWSEGFDELYSAEADGLGGFAVQPWPREGEGVPQVLEGGREESG